MSWAIIKLIINSTLGTKNFIALNDLIREKIDDLGENKKGDK